MLYSCSAPVSDRYAPGHLQREWWSRFKLQLPESSAVLSPVRIRLGDNIRSAEAKQLDEGKWKCGNTLVSDDLIDGNDFGLDARTAIQANETPARSTD
jgi:hypothetical protein